MLGPAHAAAGTRGRQYKRARATCRNWTLHSMPVSLNRLMPFNQFRCTELRKIRAFYMFRGFRYRSKATTIKLQEIRTLLVRFSTWTVKQRDASCLGRRLPRRHIFYGTGDKSLARCWCRIGCSAMSGNLNFGFGQHVNHPGALRRFLHGPRFSWNFAALINKHHYNSTPNYVKIFFFLENLLNF